jgi:hypothetical protein
VIRFRVLVEYYYIPLPTHPTPSPAWPCLDFFLVSLSLMILPMDLLETTVYRRGLQYCDTFSHQALLLSFTTYSLMRFTLFLRRTNAPR